MANEAFKAKLGNRKWSGCFVFIDNEFRVIDKRVAISVPKTNKRPSHRNTVIVYLNKGD
jgi:hypothetical protein